MQTAGRVRARFVDAAAAAADFVSDAARTLAQLPYTPVSVERTRHKKS
jgi:hypothetical protein